MKKLNIINKLIWNNIIPIRNHKIYNTNLKKNLIEFFFAFTSFFCPQIH